jgi:hypothetical protein
MAAKVRKSVPLTRDDTAGVERLRIDIAWREAALEIAGVELSESPSEAEALHALVTVGRSVLSDRAKEKTMAAGYAALAQARDDEDRAVARATGRRTAHLAD